jgi:hypothetical protein
MFRENCCHVVLGYCIWQPALPYELLLHISYPDRCLDWPEYFSVFFAEKKM